MAQHAAMEWHGRTVYDRDGEKLGTIETIYVDRRTEVPEWMLVKTGLLGTKSTFVPLQGSEPAGDDVRVPYAKSQVKEAPSIDPDHELDEHEEARIYRHYGLEYGDSRSDSQLPEGGPAAAGTGAGAAAEGRDVSGPTTDDAMTRSEEEMRVGTERRERTRARLRKYVVTEHVQTSVPVSREEVRVEREPITEANVEAALDGPEISEEEHEVVLHEERPVVGKETVPKERIRMTKDTVTGEETVTGEVRKERVEADGTDVADRP